MAYEKVFVTDLYVNKTSVVWVKRCVKYKYYINSDILFLDGILSSG